MVKPPVSICDTDDELDCEFVSDSEEEEDIVKEKPEDFPVGAEKAKSACGDEDYFFIDTSDEEDNVESEPNQEGSGREPNSNVGNSSTEEEYEFEDSESEYE